MKARFTQEEANAAGEEWGFNCGPASIAAVLGLTLAELRPHLGDFERKRYTNPTLMLEILRGLNAPVIEIIRLNAAFEMERPGCKPWPRYGLARVQWEGPWTDPGVPIRVRYRHTHWVGACEEAGSEPNIFDVNCLCVGGWVPLSEWSTHVVPWLLGQVEPKANGRWHLTHTVELNLPVERTENP